MFNKKCDCTAEYKKHLDLESAHREGTLRKDLEIERIRFTSQENEKVRQLQDKLVKLEADLTIERANSAKIKAEAKVEYTEHVMAVTDERVKEMRTLYEGYAKNLTEVVKAAASGGANVSTNVVTK